MLNPCCITPLPRPKTGTRFNVDSTLFDSQRKVVTEVVATDQTRAGFMTLPRDMRMKFAVVSYAAYILLDSSFPKIWTLHQLTGGGECLCESMTRDYQSRSISQYSSLQRLYERKLLELYASAAHSMTTLHIHNQPTRLTWHSLTK